MHSSIKDPMFTQTVEHDWRSQLLIICKFIIFLLSIITFPLSSKFREIMLFFLCLLYLKYVVSLNISIVSITTLNKYLAVNIQQLPEIPKKALNTLKWTLKPEIATTRSQKWPNIHNQSKSNTWIEHSIEWLDWNGKKGLVTTSP